MTDPSTIALIETAIKAGALVVGSKEILLKLLGPSADYIGQSGRSIIEKCDINVSRIFERMAKRLKGKIDEPGQVNVRVLKEAYTEGRFCEDETLADYYGGILASSRSVDGKDDRALPMLALLKNLSVAQVVFHFAAYRAFYELFKRSPYKLGIEDKKMQIFVPCDAFDSIIPDWNKVNSTVSLIHAASGLLRASLITSHGYGYPDFLGQRTGKTFPSYGIVVSPTIDGAELFLRSQGHETWTGHFLFQHEVNFEPEQIDVTSKVIRVDDAPGVNSKGQ